MRPKFESFSRVDEYKEQAMSGVREFIESKGYFMNLLEHNDKSFRFQIWKDADGLPLTTNEGLNEFVETLRRDCGIIQDETEVNLSYLASGIVHITVELDKTK